MAPKDSGTGAVLIFPEAKVPALRRLSDKSTSVLSWEELYRKRERPGDFTACFEPARLFVLGPFYIGKKCKGFDPKESLWKIWKCLAEYNRAKGVLTVALVPGPSYPFNDRREPDGYAADSPLCLAYSTVDHLRCLLDIPVRPGSWPSRALHPDENVSQQDCEFPRSAPLALKALVKRHNSKLALAWGEECDPRYCQPVAWYERNKASAAFYRINRLGRALILPLARDLDRKDLGNLMELSRKLTVLDRLLPYLPEALVPTTPERAGMEVLDETAHLVRLRAYGRECSVSNQSGHLLEALEALGGSATEEALQARFGLTSLAAVKQTYKRLREDLGNAGFSRAEIRALIARTEQGGMPASYRLGDSLMRTPPQT